MNSKDAFDRIFNPRSVAILGASQDNTKFSYYLLRSLLTGGFEGPIYLVNPKVEEISGFQCYPSVKDVPEKVDLAVIVLPVSAVVRALSDCAEKGVSGAIIITAGFKESEDEAGEELQKEIAGIADAAGIKIIGPNTFGMFNTHANLNACFTPYFINAAKGPISIVTQSGGACHFLMPWLVTENVGLSKVLSLGNRANTDYPELIEYLLDDPQTKAIAMYMEGVDDPRPLLEVGRKAIGKKPLVVYKVGKGEAVRNAALSHTGSLAGRYELYEAAFDQAGIITTDSLTELLDVTKALALQSPPRGNRVAITSTVAGPVLMATDICESSGLCITRFTEKTQKKLNELIPPIVARTNPIDWANNIEIIETVLQDDNVDMLVSLYVYAISYSLFQLPSDDLIALSKKYGKPIIVGANAPSNMWQFGIADLERSGIPVYPMPDRAAWAAVALARYGEITRENKIG
ncbi:MAG: CoA-binding protein [Chloroflexota bacterium]|nr:CoA-binding protein [Chloroflexota bacterium]